MMTTVRRASLGLGALAAMVSLPPLLTGLQLVRAMVAPARQPLNHTPSEVGLPYEPAFFTSADGVPLRGWFIPAQRSGPAPAVVIIHGWPWNRLGNAAERPLAPGVPNQPVDLLAPAAAFHRTAGYHVLMFDLRNHGISGSRGPVTFGLRERHDLAAAVGWLRARGDVDGSRIGLLGFSMGANTAMLTIPAIQPIAAAALIQPAQPTTFAKRIAQHVFGPLAPLMLAQSERIYTQLGGPSLQTIDLVEAAAHLGPTAALYVQGTGDPWGAITDTALMARATPGPKEVILPETHDRFGGYHWTADHEDRLVAFFQRFLGPAA